MREIRNDVELSKLQNHSKKEPQPTKEIAAEDSKELKDFSNPAAEALGRSQVSPSKKIEKDVNEMIQNPEKIENANKYFDYAFQTLKKTDAEHPYEEASVLMDAYKKEFLD